MLEVDGLFPAPYMARIYWVAAERWSVFRTAEWEHQLRTAHEFTFVKLPPKVHTVLALPAAKQRRLVLEHGKAERKKLPASR